MYRHHLPGQSNSNSTGPTPREQRIVILDILRGFALLGILLVNIMSFSGIWSGSQDWTDGADQAVDGMIHFFIRGKFLSLFAILFGIGFALQTNRLAAKSDHFLLIYGRRLFVLFLIGLLHLALDPAEVLSVYAVCGTFLVLFQKVQLKILLIGALLIMPLPYLHTAIISASASEDSATQSLKEAEDVEQQFNQQVEEKDEETESEYGWNPYTGETAIRVYSEGVLTEILAYNVKFSINRWTSSWVNYLWMSVPLPLMLIGLFIGRSKILERLQDKVPRVRIVFWTGLSVGIGGTWLGEKFFEWTTLGGWDPWLWFIGSVLWVLGSWLMSLGYAAGIVLLVQREYWKKLLMPMEAVGRFALTNYLLQTCICTTLFYTFGFDLYGKLGPTDVTLLAVSIYLLQVILSFLWSRRFRFGPVEWLWRSITYGRVQPMQIV
jgi:uncharacterized protein